MNRSDAIREIKQIRSGSGVYKYDYPNSMKGEIAKDLWYTCGKFDLGFEYGYIFALMRTFDIREYEL